LRPDPFFSVFLAQRLLAKGKLKKVALTAAMRKLTIILNTLVQTTNCGRILQMHKRKRRSDDPVTRTPPKRHRRTETAGYPSHSCVPAELRSVSPAPETVLTILTRFNNSTATHRTLKPHASKNPTSLPNPFAKPHKNRIRKSFFESTVDSFQERR